MYESISDAQHRVDQVEAFERELDLLEKEQVLTLERSQQESITNYHEHLLDKLTEDFDIDKNHREKHLSLGMKISSFLGAIALSSSLFFFFYQFWDYFSLSIQVLLLILFPLLFLALTMFVYYRDKSGYISKIFALLSIVAFALNLSILGNIFSILPSPQAILVLSLLAFALAYASNTRLIVAFAILALASYLSAKMGTMGGMYWIHFGYKPENFILPAFVLFFIPLLFTHKKFDGFDVIYRVFAMLLFFLPVLILSNYGRASYLGIDSNTIEVFYQIVGFVVSALAIWIGIIKGWNEVVNTGNTFFTLFLYTKFYDWWWDFMPKYIFFLIIGITAVGLLMLFKQIRKQNRGAIK